MNKQELWEALKYAPIKWRGGVIPQYEKISAVNLRKAGCECDYPRMSGLYQRVAENNIMCHMCGTRTKFYVK